MVRPKCDDIINKRSEKENKNEKKMGKGQTCKPEESWEKTREGTYPRWVNASWGGLHVLSAIYMCVSFEDLLSIY